MREEDLTPQAWSNAPGDIYGWHEHSYEKALYCVRGRIVFHTDRDDDDLGPGDRLVLPPRPATARPNFPGKRARSGRIVSSRRGR